MAGQTQGVIWEEPSEHVVGGPWGELFRKPLGEPLGRPYGLLWKTFGGTFGRVFGKPLGNLSGIWGEPLGKPFGGIFGECCGEFLGDFQGILWVSFWGVLCQIPMGTRLPTCKKQPFGNRVLA